jgi:phospholipid transport system substrate-binding protein
MIQVFSTFLRGSILGRQRTGMAAACLAAGLAAFWTMQPAKPAVAADSAVIFMAQVGRELMAAARTHSPSVMANVIQKYGDVRGIGDFSLGSYRSKLAEADSEAYYAGMVRFIARYASSMAPKFPVTKVEWENLSVRGAGGVMVDSTVTLRDGTSWNVRWVLRKIGDTYKVRDAEVLGVRMTPYLKDAFEDYINQNGGHTRALVLALSR